MNFCLEERPLDKMLSTELYCQPAGVIFPSPKTNWTYSLYDRFTRLILSNSMNIPLTTNATVNVTVELSNDFSLDIYEVEFQCTLTNPIDSRSKVTRVRLCGKLSLCASLLRPV